MFVIFRDNIYIPFFKVGFVCLFFSYIAYLAYNVVTPGYFIDAFFTNPSFFVAIKFAAVYLVFCALVTLVLSAALYAYIEIGRYRQQVTFLTEERKVFEVRIPETGQETLASMEALLEMISYGSGEGRWFPVWWNGKKRVLYSFEIVSKGGIVSFIIHTRALVAEAVRSAVYSFYPKAQITDVDDYVYDFEYVEDEYDIFSIEWKFKEDNALPIKTYVEFQDLRQPVVALDKTMQQPIDPIAALYDFFGSISGDEQLWVQYVFRTQKYSRAEEGASDDPLVREYWKQQKLPEEIHDALVALEKKVRGGEGEESDPVVLNAAEKRLRDIGTRIAEKQALEVGIRSLYIAKEGAFDKGRISPFLSVYKLTNAADNSLIPQGAVIEDVSEVPALEPPRDDKDEARKQLLQLYRDRMFWFAPALREFQPSDVKRKEVDGPTLKRVATVMSTETLATVCHFPTGYIKTPTVRRVQSTEVEPPENLPV
ncbi:MAG: hypothetical protein OXB96_00995 [Candidatus Kaiserbacteria bacterium]|nr:hypothetical protein [Candidatus Kaiserbacteria bacterium]